MFSAWPCLLRQVGAVLGSPYDYVLAVLAYANPGSRQVCTWGRHALSILQPTCGLQSDRRLSSGQGSISLHDSISTKDSAILGADCSLPVARCTGLWHNR